MKNNKMELSEALQQTNGQDQSKQVPTPSQSARPAARQGKKLIGGHFDKEVHRQLKMMSFEEECSVQSLLGEALDYLFVNRGKPPIASKGQ